jgi:HAD superfamily hydrolase (TIGR01484 family)
VTRSVEPPEKSCAAASHASGSKTARRPAPSLPGPGGRAEHAPRLVLGPHGTRRTTDEHAAGLVRDRVCGLPRLIASDLDGTLLGVGGAVSRRTAAVFREAAVAGTVVVLVTGRPIRWLPPVYEDLGAVYPTVCANGAVVYDPVADLVRDSWPVRPAILYEACTRLRARVPDVVFAVEVDGGRGLRHEPGWPTGADFCTAPARLDEMLARPVAKLLASCFGRNADEFAAMVTQSVGDIVEATYSSGHAVVEMSRRGVNKATGLAQVAAGYDVAAEDVLAFGDMPNDVSMLSWAGRSVAVANAHPLVRAVADEVTLSHLDDGVAAYLERLLAA